MKLIKQIVSIVLSVSMIVVMLSAGEFVLSVTAIDSRIEAAVQTAVSIANDDSHGYSQPSRQGPDYDCSSLVYYAFSSAGFDLSPKWFSTRTMGQALINAGFTELTSLDLSNSNQLIRGDILWKSGHTEIYIGGNKRVGAHQDRGCPQTGDQPGNEISGETYTASQSWTKVYRYAERPYYPDYPGEDKNISWVQRVLIDLGYDLGSYGVDGSKGPITTQRIKDFQSDNGLDNDGLVGPNTWAKLTEKLHEKYDAKTEVTFSTGNVSLDMTNNKTASLTATISGPYEHWLCEWDGDVIGVEKTQSGDQLNITVTAKKIGSSVLRVIAQNSSENEIARGEITVTCNGAITFSYNANGGSGTMATQTIQNDGELTISKCGFTRQGYVFDGWTVKRDKQNTWAVSGHDWQTETTISANGWAKQVFNPGDRYTIDGSWYSTAPAGETFTFYATWTACSHTWNSGSVTTVATCTTTGVKTLTCTQCSATKTESIPAKGHDYGSWTKLNDTQHQRVCSRDSSHVEKADHSWGGWITVTEPTVAADGLKKCVCTICNATKTEPIPRLTPEIVYGDANGDGVVNGKDLILLRRYLANYDDKTGTSTVEIKSGADANGDGTVNGKDLILVRRYLANYDDKTGTSTVKLGPAA